jgi:hypothetical protein
MEVPAFDSRLSHVCFAGVGAKVCGARGFLGFARGVLVRARGVAFEVVCWEWFRTQIVLHVRRGSHITRTKPPTFAHFATATRREFQARRS